MRTKFLGNKHEHFESEFCFISGTTTIFFSPGEGFYLLIGTENKIEKAYFNAEVMDLSVKLIFKNGEERKYNLAYYPLYFKIKFYKGK